MNNYDGSIIIGTNIDTKGIDQGINDIEKKVTGKSFGNKFSSMFSSIFSKISTGANKTINTITKGLGSILSSIGGIAGAIAKISLIGIIGMILLASNYSETSKTQLQEIANIVLNLADTLARLILPIAEAIVNLIYEGVKWIAELLNGWFGIDLFAKRTDKSLKSGVKSAKALRKQLLGFDEMDILKKDGSIGGLGSGTGGSGGGNNNQAVTFPDIAGSLMQRAVDACNEAIKGGGIGGGLATLIFGKKSPITKAISKINKATTESALGLGIWKLLFGKGKSGTMQDLKEILNSTSGMTKEMANKIKEDFSEIKVSYSDGMVHVVTKTGQAVDLTEKEFKELMTSLGYETGQAFEDLKKNSEETSKKSVGAWLSASITIKNGFVGKDGAEGVINGAFNNIQISSSTTSDNIKKNWIAAGKEGANGVLSAFNPLPNQIENIFDKITPTFENAGTATGTAVSAAMAGAINGGLGKTESTINTAINAIKQALNQTAAAAGGAVSAALVAKTALIKKISLPRIKLASGGIINQPGRGINYGIANIGERGREGVIPLDNQSAMNTLANEISKRIVINLTNVTEIDGRQLARTTAQVMNDMQFASNGGVI